MARLFALTIVSVLTGFAVFGVVMIRISQLDVPEYDREQSIANCNASPRCRVVAKMIGDRCAPRMTMECMDRAAKDAGEAVDRFIWLATKDR